MKIIRIPVTTIILVGLTLTLQSCSKKTVTGGGSTVTPPPVNPGTPVKTDVKMWLTTQDKTQLLDKQNISLLFTSVANSNTTINVDTTTTYQTIDGFGFALTGGSAQVINSLSSTVNSSIINELFSTDSTSIGISYIRLTIGASDMSASPFTYDDVASGSTDVNLQQFSIDMEKADLIPTLKKIIAINPNIKILACPWSAPAWMKTNNSLSGGSLLPQYYSTYANYFVKYIQAMAAQGITIDAITPQNEPLNPSNNPAMVMQDTAEAKFIGSYLGPALQAASITTKIICYDHNCDRPDYPIYVLNDQTANKYVDGSAFHLYLGDISALTPVHTAFPNKNIYFTEQATFGTGSFSGDLSWHVNNLIVGAIRNWSRNVIEWNLASDPNYGPHTNGGCTSCQGAITVNNNTSVSRNVSYYIVAHASKFVRPGAVRIASDASTTLPNVAFKNTDGTKVLIVLNNTNGSQTFNIKFNSKTVTSTLNYGAVATYVW
ncbi:glucosylceramidase [Mucilaginibacter mallensis]|uniref:Glucosylceramidase n=1 Tax=Mucilaginibacter mallensis TaxID=652787 RepID=A0A1H1TJH0_MUCMA|nr:glycoside hydrolase family 30 beta sandwich domain-containing protein [Mucilaginibacter mallensis]SDS60106.1 glucosylceramidase [Mucilaginibacter mallensis]